MKIENAPLDKLTLDPRTATCKACRQEKPVGDFEADAKMRTGHRSTCRECRKGQKLAGYYANAETINAARKAAYHANPAKLRASSLASYHRHAERRKPYRTAYRRANADRCRADCHNRRARLLRVGGRYTARDVRRMYHRQRGCCFWCGTPVKDEYEVDHVHPLSRGGSNWPENLVVACEWCNGSRHDKFPAEWLFGRPAGKVRSAN